MDKNRSKIIRRGLMAVMGVIILRLFFMQVVEYDEWTARAEAQQTMKTTIKAKRGEIYLMDGSEPKVVAMNETVWTVIVDPKISERSEVEKAIMDIVSDKVTADFDKVFKNPESRYAVVARDVERPAAKALAEREVTGIWLQESTKRTYPEGELASTVLGFVNAEGEGQYGVEGAMNEELKGKDGLLKTVKDIHNVALSIGDDNIKVPAEDGESVVLTIDRNLQNTVERVLAEETPKYGKDHSSAVVMDPQSGKVLAMANYPGYNPGDYGKVKDVAVYSNGVLQDAYEPASVCKTFAFAAAINEGKMTKDSTYNNTGSTTVDGREIKNSAQNAPKGTINMQTVLNWSLNTGSIQALRWLGGSESEITQVGREKLYEYYNGRFGLGVYTGIELREAAGLLTEPNANAYGLNATYANMTFGQNMQVTMIQVAAAFASVVNGGDYYMPTVVAGKMVDGEFIKAEKKTPVRQTVSSETSAAMRELLYGTRSRWRPGTGTGSDPDGYYVGGKTGTAQTIKDGKYQSDETVASYIGFGGTEGELPKYVIMVRIWKEGTYADGEKMAMPLFNALKDPVQEYLRVKPKGAE